MEEVTVQPDCVTAVVGDFRSESEAEVMDERSSTKQNIDGGFSWWVRQIGGFDGTVCKTIVCNAILIIRFGTLFMRHICRVSLLIFTLTVSFDV